MDGDATDRPQHGEWNDVNRAQAQLATAAERLYMESPMGLSRCGAGVGDDLRHLSFNLHEIDDSVVELVELSFHRAGRLAINVCRPQCETACCQS